MNRLEIQKAVCSAFESEESLDKTEIEDLAFHMTDWLDELEEYHRFASDPNCYSPDELRQLLIKILVHVPSHINQAADLVLK